MPVYLWSQTASANATADPTINFAEGQAPSSVNDSARALMAAAAKYRDDVAGANLGTAGTSTAYTVSSNQVFDTVPHMVAQHLTIFPHATNGANPTLNVDGLGDFPIITDGSGTAVPVGAMVAGTPYELMLDGGNHFRLKNFYAKPYEMPIGAVMEFYGSSVPNSSFALPNGQAISRTTYSALFALIGTTYGTGDGSTTFNLPDLTGRVTAMKEASATRLTSTYFGGNSTSLGAVGGLESETLTLAQTPAGITSAGSVTGSVTSIALSARTASTTGSNDPSTLSISTFSGSAIGPITAPFSSGSISGTASVTSNNTSGLPHPNVQPTIICNKIMRII